MLEWFKLKKKWRRLYKLDRLIGKEKDSLKRSMYYIERNKLFSELMGETHNG